jgi:DNA topoisomerase-1
VEGLVKVFDHALPWDIETREGAERAYQKIEIIEGAISESTPVESTGAEKNKLFPTSVAYLLNDFLVKYFSEIVDYQFTAKLESDFDTIATQNVPWQGVVKNFYKPFHQKVEDAADISREERQHWLGTVCFFQHLCFHRG